MNKQLKVFVFLPGNRNCQEKIADDEAKEDDLDCRSPV